MKIALDLLPTPQERADCARSDYPAWFDRFDICEAYAVLEWDWNCGGWLQERPSNQRRREATACQLERLQFRARPDLSYSTLTENGRAIYDAAEQRLGLTPCATS